MALKELRNKAKLTQKEASEITGVPLRTYKRYESGETNSDSFKYNQIYAILKNYLGYDENGMLLDGKVLLVTGGTGSFGNAIVKRFINTNIKEIRILSRDEKKQDDMRKAYNSSKLKFYIGDVRDYNSIIDAFKGVDYVFHAAALKQVPSCEFYPMEAVKTNVLGSDNVITASINSGVKKAVFLSTDKATYPINAMGMTKALMEKNVIARSRNLGPDETILCLTRYGNVMASRGSVIPLFIDQINAGKPITVTNPKMTRFMMTLDEAVDLVLYAFENGKQGELFVQKAPAATIDCLAKAIFSLMNKEPNVEYIGTRHGEKLYETLVTQEEMVRSEDVGDFYLVHPDTRDLNYEKYFSVGSKELNRDKSFTSDNAHRLSVGEMKNLLLKLDLFK